ncbi:MAG TPA: hypothetical protein VGW32_02545 [Pyrinomonadaceae bacterium]|nr:hypothetical protein [Pyrinomonadaceae bacterium]
MTWYNRHVSDALQTVLTYVAIPVLVIIAGGSRVRLLFTRAQASQSHYNISPRVPK